MAFPLVAAIAANTIDAVLVDKLPMAKPLKKTAASVREADNQFSDTVNLNAMCGKILSASPQVLSTAAKICGVI